MTIPRRIPRTRKPEGSAHRLNQSHPLARYVSFAVFGGSVPRDISRNGQAIVSTLGTPTVAADRYGTATSYDGNSNHVFGTDAIVDMSRPWTLATRFRLKSDAAQYTYLLTLATANADSSEPFLFFFSTNANYYPYSMGIATSTGPFRGQIGGGAATDKNVWFDIAIQYDGTGNGGAEADYDMWVNGVEDVLVDSGAAGTRTNRTQLSGSSGGGDEADVDTAYVVVLDGIMAAEQLVRPEQVLRLLAPTTQHIPTAAAVATTTSLVPRRVAATRQPV